MYIKDSPKLFLLFMMFSVISVPTQAQNIIGKISLSGKQASKASLKDVVVYFESEIKKLPTPLNIPYQVRMKNKAFHPRVSVVPVGSQLNVSNHDSILHNAFSPSRSNQFDLGLYGKGKQKLHLLDRPGVVKIFCNVHYHMVAYVVVLDTPYYALTDEKGNFILNGLPNESGKLIFWHERGKRVVKNISYLAPSSNARERIIKVDIPITKRRIPAHKTKNGKSYKKKRRKRGY
jgi:plastocyanin